jgi:hypothetical protein
MIRKLVFLLGISTLLASPLLADGLADGLGDEAPANSKESPDHRIRFTVLYIGEYKHTEIQPFLADKKFTLTYLVEDMRSAEEAQRNPAKSPDGSPTDYYVRCVPPEVEDGHHKLMTGGSVDQMPFELALKPEYKSVVAHLKLPKVEFPERAMIYQFLFTAPAEGPFDLVFHDYMPAYGESHVHFGHVDPAALPTP